MTNTTYTDTVKPVRKWAGGKTQLLGQLISLMPSDEITAYCEPFLGSGAMLLYIQPGIAYVNPDSAKLKTLQRVSKKSESSHYIFREQGGVYEREQ